MKSFLSKYDKTINIKLLLQDEDTEKSIDKISMKVLNDLYYFDSKNILKKNKVENKENNNSNEEEEEPEDDITGNCFSKIPLNNKEETLSNDIKINEAEPFSIDFETKQKKWNYNEIKDNFVKELFLKDQNLFKGNKK